MSTAHFTEASSTPVVAPEPVLIQLFEPFTGKAIQVRESDYYVLDNLEPCILCGELTEPRNLATLAPPHVCEDCMDREAARYEPIRAREIA